MNDLDNILYSYSFFSYSSFNSYKLKCHDALFFFMISFFSGPCCPVIITPAIQQSNVVVFVLEIHDSFTSDFVAAAWRWDEEAAQKGGGDMNQRRRTPSCPLITITFMCHLTLLHGQPS